MNPVSFWQGKRVLITGHTGFKGSWLSLWLQSQGAAVVGYALSPPTSPSLYELAGVAGGMESVIGDIRDRAHVQQVIVRHKPEIVFHLAAQSLVRKSYEQPVENYAVNVMGTVHLFDAIRTSRDVRVVVNVTSDKCYDNKEWPWGYRETDPLGGHDPYSNSKGCAELVTEAFRKSYFQQMGVRLASARAGNVIGGGDWACDRLVPDLISSIMADQPPNLRNPLATRPWQHVLEPLSGYLRLAERLWQDDGAIFAQAWNFGPVQTHLLTVRELASRLLLAWGKPASWVSAAGEHPHEAQSLQLDSSKAGRLLRWRPVLTVEETVGWTVDWYKAFSGQQPMREFTLNQIKMYDEMRTTRV